jgi:NarL family two-component system response regulator LiaR
MTDRNTILIVDSHPSVRSGLRALIKTTPDMKVIGEAHDCVSAVQTAHNLSPDIIILDMMSTARNGLTIVRALRQASPHSQILILTDYDGSEQILDVIREGARGYLLKDPLSTDIASAIREVLAGKLIIHRGLAHTFENARKEDFEDIPGAIPELVSFP